MVGCPVGETCYYVMTALIGTLVFLCFGESGGQEVGCGGLIGYAKDGQDCMTTDLSLAAQWLF